MNRSDWLWRLAFASPIGLAAYAIAAHVGLLAGASLSALWLPVAFAIGGAAAMTRPAPGRDQNDRAPTRFDRLVPFFMWLLLLSGIGFATYGAVATADREWDGLVSWSLRARYFAPPVDLSHPVFTDPGVFAHSFAYPALQPLCLGAFQTLFGELPGRVFFPAVFAAFLALVAATGRETGLIPTERRLLVIAFGTTPMWFSAGSGAIDSGYGDLFLAFFLTVGAAGMLTGRRSLLAAAALCLPLVKPEGVPYGLLLALVTFFTTTGRGRHAAVTLGLGLGIGLGSHLAARVAGQAASWWPPLVLVLGLLALSEVRQRTRWSIRAWLGAGGVAAAALVALPWLLPASTVEQSPLLREFVANVATGSDRLIALPRVLLGYLTWFVAVRKFGFVYILFFALLCIRPAWSVAQPHRGMFAFFAGGLALACLAILFGSDTNWDHVFKSRFDRLLLQWTGVGWLAVGPWLAAVWRR